ncbi:hypothetical protein FNJ84_09615 [Paracoccus sp. M683]|uniref:dihydrofolate reductase family protein n=1 Tax=Paracoccus sp. M683 TaxID=2594268 RepID=UPI00117EA064|nr:dihydrofolate reductase family protein [Paracoccus sp. M683]TRW97732.1 hypothetical protein FNJ84_09615 [Paracoccus sp. M683]
MAGPRHGRGPCEDQGWDGPDLIVPGSSDFIQTLLTYDLFDQFKLVICPVVLGKGNRLFGSGTIPTTLTIRQSSRSAKGVTCLVLDSSGGVRVGDFSPPA